MALHGHRCESVAGVSCTAHMSVLKEGRRGTRHAHLGIAAVLVVPSVIQCCRAAEVSLLWPTPVQTSNVLVSGKMSSAEVEDLAWYATRLAETMPTIHRSNVGGWHSDFNLHLSTRKSVQRLVQVVAEEACNYLQAGFDKPRNKSLFITGLWANVNPPGASNAAHVHQVQPTELHLLLDHWRLIARFTNCTLTLLSLVGRLRELWLPSLCFVSQRVQVSILRTCRPKTRRRVTASPLSNSPAPPSGLRSRRFQASSTPRDRLALWLHLSCSSSPESKLYAETTLVGCNSETTCKWTRRQDSCTCFLPG